MSFSASNIHLLLALMVIFNEIKKQKTPVVRMYKTFFFVSLILIEKGTLGVFVFQGAFLYSFEKEM